MGSTASKAASRVSQRAPSTIKVPQSWSPPNQTKVSAVKPASKPDPNVSARIEKPQPVAYKRKTTAEWSETLKKISGAISSAAWEGELQPHSDNAGDKERHPAQRSSTSVSKLPRRTDRIDSGSETMIQPDGEGMIHRPMGRLSQNDILQVFHLRRTDPERWSAAAIASKFKIDEDDTRDLLRFTRTYMGREDTDGRLRAYYNPDLENTISRFEKD